MSSSELSDLTSTISTDDDVELAPAAKGKLEHYFKNGSSATQKTPQVKRRRAPSPPHEYVLADNSDIAFICMFRSRFSDAFLKSLPHYGPQDIEHGVVESIPGEQVERLLCALLGLVLNRKKEVEKGHYSRALEEAVHAHIGQWPVKWQGKNPLHGGGSFNNMTPEQRLTLLKTLIIWSLESSDAVKTIIKDSHKQQRHDDDLNQPLSVQPWGKDGDKRRYWLIEGQDDTHFRLYRESNPALKHNTWRSVAGTIDEVKDVAERLGEENSQAGRRLRDRINAAVPRFEASEEKRKRRDYRMARKAQFTRPEPGFSLYEGRTRGKRIRYTYSDEEDGGSDAPSARRSNRHSGLSTPVELAGPTFTASGRQVRSRHGGAYGETTLSRQEDATEQVNTEMLGDVDDGDSNTMSRDRSRRFAQSNGVKAKARSGRRIDGYRSSDEMDDESDATSSGHDWDGGDDDEVDEPVEDDEEDEDVEMSDDDGSVVRGEDDAVPRSLIVSLRYPKERSPPSPQEANKTTLSSDAHTNPSIPPAVNESYIGVGKATDRSATSLLQLSVPAQISAHPLQPSTHDEISRDLIAPVPQDNVPDNPHAFVFNQTTRPTTTEYYAQNLSYPQTSTSTT